jgi:hypothetical protein
MQSQRITHASSARVTQPSSKFLKSVTFDCSKAKDKQPCLSLGFGGG